MSLKKLNATREKEKEMTLEYRFAVWHCEEHKPIYGSVVARNIREATKEIVLNEIGVFLLGEWPSYDAFDVMEVDRLVPRRYEFTYQLGLQPDDTEDVNWNGSADWIPKRGYMRSEAAYGKKLVQDRWISLLIVHMPALECGGIMIPQGEKG